MLLKLFYKEQYQEAWWRIYQREVPNEEIREKNWRQWPRVNNFKKQSSWKSCNNSSANLDALHVRKMYKYIIPMIAARTKRLSKLQTIILTPRGVGRILWRGPPRGGWGGIGGGGTFKWYAFCQRPPFPLNNEDTVWEWWNKWEQN